MKHYDIFISYSRKDSETAASLCRVLDAHGISYFIDKKGISGGEEFASRICQAIRESQLMLFLASIHSYESVFTRREIHFAYQRIGKEFVIPYVIDKTEMPDEIFFMFSNSNILYLDECPMETTLIMHLLSRLGRQGQVTSDKKQKPHLIIGTIGLFDHGKTTLTAAITLTLTNRIGGKNNHTVWYNQLDSDPQEQEWGITIHNACVDYETQKCFYSHIDSPGFKDYLPTTYAAMAKMKGAILVVSLVDGEYNEVAKIVKDARSHGVHRMVVFINKVDLVDEEQIAPLITEVRRILIENGFELSTPIVCGSALGALNNIGAWQDKVMELMDACDSWFLDA